MKNGNVQTLERMNPITRKGARRALAFFLALLMVFSVTATPVEAFSLKGFFKDLSKSINAIAEIANPPAKKTVKSFSELSEYVSSLLGPSHMTATLGANITIPSNKTISNTLRDITIDLNGYTIYVDNPKYGICSVAGNKLTVKNGTIVQRVNNSLGTIYISAGDLWMSNVKIKGTASSTIGFYSGGAIADPESTLNNVTFTGLTTGMRIESGAEVIVTNSKINNSKGDAIYLPENTFDQKSTLEMSDSTITNFAGNGIRAEFGTKTELNNVKITGGTSRNRYGILVGKTDTLLGDRRPQVSLNGNTEVKNNVGGNIGVHHLKENGQEDNGSSVNISLSGATAYSYSFTVADGLNGTKPAAMAQVSTGIGSNIRSYNLKSDISRYMVRNEGSTILIQNPPEQCTVNVETNWIAGKALNTEKDANYAIANFNDGTKNAIVKYDTRMTLATVNNDPTRYKFLGWYKYTYSLDENGNKVYDGSKVEVSKSPICQIDVIDEYVTYRAEYQYMQYTITVVKNGNGSVAGGGTYWVDDVVTLTATADTPVYVSSGSTQVLDKAYGFSRWNDAGENTSETPGSVVDAQGKTITYTSKVTRDVVVKGTTTYVASFKKVSQTSGILYRGLKEVTDGVVPDGNLLLVFVGKGFENNRMETGGEAGTLFGVTGLPEGSAKMRKATETESKDKHPYNDNKESYSFVEGKANYYGYAFDSTVLNQEATVNNTTCVYWTQKAADFDNCNPGFVQWNSKLNCWLYWCCGSAVEAAGPYILYSYTDEIPFDMNSVSVTMSSKFRPDAEGNTVSSSAIVATAKDKDGNVYTLGGLKFGNSNIGLDNSIDYTEGDKSIAIDLDGITYDYDFPEAIVGETQYTKLADAISSAAISGAANTIEIVGPGVDSIEGPVDLGQGDIIKGYNGEKAIASSSSSIGVDKDGTVRLHNGAIEVEPGTTGTASAGIKDSFVTTNKEITITTDENGQNAVIRPQDDETILQISPDNNPDHIVIITGASSDNTYEFDNIPLYGGERVEITSGAAFTVNVPMGEDTVPIEVNKFNSGNTVISDPAQTGIPTISSTGEGDKVTVGDKTYTTGDKGHALYQVNPDPTAVPSVILSTGEVGIPTGSTIQVGNTIIKNTGSTSGGAITGEGTVQVEIDAEGKSKIDIPNGGGVQIGDMEIQVPAKTPLNGNTTVTLDGNGQPTIETSGGSEVKLNVNGKETIYEVGDYDAKITIGKDGIPVIQDGEIVLKPGQVVKDRLGNEYRCPEGATDGITIMTTPPVSRTDEDGEVFEGGGNMSFIIPTGGSIQYKPTGSLTYQEFENPGDGEGFFNLDPENAKDGIQADSEMGLAPGKSINVGGLPVKAPAGSTPGAIQIDGSTGTVSLNVTGAAVEIGGKTYIANTVVTDLVIDEYGVHLEGGSVFAGDGAPIIVDGMEVTANDNGPILVVAGESNGSGYDNAKILAGGGSSEVTFTTKPAGSKDAGITYQTEGATGEENVKTYEVAPDGTLYLPAGDRIKQGNTVITAPAEKPLSLTPLSKPSASDVSASQGDIIPLGGLLISVPTEAAVQIGNNIYSESTVTGGPASELQLVLDGNDVVLYGGTLALTTGSAISLYDVNNKKGTILNTSNGDQEPLQITNPGIVTMPTRGSSVTMGDGKTSVEYTSTEPNTQLVYTSDITVLKDGGVELDQGEKILMAGMIVTNTGNSEMQVSLNTTERETGSGENVDISYTQTGTIKIKESDSFRLSADLDASTSVTYRTNNPEGTGEATFTLTEDGTLAVPDGAIMDIVDGSKKVEVQAFGAAGEKVETLPTEDGIMMAIPKNGHVLVNGVKYTNTGDEHLVLSVDKDGKVVLLQGEVDLSEGAIVYVESSDETLVPIQNTSVTTGGSITVKYDGVKYDENGTVTDDSYQVSFDISTGSSISIGGNKYGVSEEDTTDVTINMNIGPITGSAITSNGTVTGDRIQLTGGTVEMKPGSSIKVDSSVLTNNGGSANAPIEVGTSGVVVLPTGSAITIKGEETTTTVEVPAIGEDYQVKVDMSDSNGNINVGIQSTDPNATPGSTGSGNQVIINGGTYESNEDGKDLNLSIDASGENKGDVTLGGGSESVKLSGGASITVGDTTVTSENAKPITVVSTQAAIGSGGSNEMVPQINIPAGGEANISSGSNPDISVKVPVNNAGGENADQEFSIDKDGNITTNLKQDESVVIGGVEYTGTADGDIKVEGSTGNLIDKPGGNTPAISIDPKEFSNPNYVFRLEEGQSVTVNGVIYQVPTGSSITLRGNELGTPIVHIEGADQSIVIGGVTYTTGTADTMFTVNANGKIVLKDNSNLSPKPSENSTLCFNGTGSWTVGDVTYKGSSETDAYTVTWQEGGSRVEVADGSKVRVDIPNGLTVRVKDKMEFETTDENGEKTTVTADGSQSVPITMKGGKSTIYLDKSQTDKTDTVVLQITGLKEIKPTYTSDKVTAIVIDDKQTYIPPVISGGNETGSSEEEKEDTPTSIPASGGKDQNNVEIPIIVEGDKIYIDTITDKMVDKLLQEKVEEETETEDTENTEDSEDTEGEKPEDAESPEPVVKKVVVLDCSAVDKNIVVLDVPTMENLASKVDEIQIKTVGAEITIDKTATLALLDQAEGTTIEIKVNVEETSILNEVQAETLKNYNVDTCLEAYAESNGIRIHDFNGGTVKVGIPWEIAPGRKMNYYHVYYLDDEGVMSLFDTVYEDGMLCFETDHFSEYVIVYDETFMNSTRIDNAPLLAVAVKAKKTKIKVKWNELEGAKKYVIYAAKCNASGEVYNLTKIDTVDASQLSYKLKGLEAGTSYKIKVVAKANGEELNKSVLMHVTTKGGEFNNASDIRILQDDIRMKVGKVKRLKLEYAYDEKSLRHAGIVRFLSGNEDIVTVNKKGKIRAHQTGTCYVYAILNTGEYARIEVTVR